MSVLFFSRPRSDSWPHHGGTFCVINTKCGDNGNMIPATQSASEIRDK